MVEIDSYDEMVINFMYPKNFELEYIVPVVRLEIGPLAEWLHSHNTAIATRWVGIVIIFLDKKYYLKLYEK